MSFSCLDGTQDVVLQLGIVAAAFFDHPLALTASWLNVLLVEACVEGMVLRG